MQVGPKVEAIQSFFVARFVNGGRRCCPDRVDELSREEMSGPFLKRWMGASRFHLGSGGGRALWVAQGLDGKKC